MHRQHLNTIWLGSVCALSVLGCGDDGAGKGSLPWNDNQATVISGTTRALDEVDASECLELEGDECEKPAEACGGRHAEVVVGDRGELLELVCYPESATLSLEELAAQEGNVAQNQNNAVIVIGELEGDVGDADSADDAAEAEGVDLDGNLSVDANNVVVWGDSPETAVIGGDVLVDGNNIIVRGVHITGDVTILANNAFFLGCIIEGNVSVTGNNAVFSASDVLGQVTVTGNNARLTANHIAGGLSDDGKNTVCEHNLAAVDGDADGSLEESELGEPLVCASKSDKK